MMRRQYVSTPAQPPHTAARGFTMVELMIALAVAAILVVIAVPSFQAAARSSQLRTLASDLVANAYLARSEAIKRNTVVSLCASSDGLGCDDDETNWQIGWIVACPTNAAATACVPGGDNWLVLQRQQEVPARMNVLASRARVNFQPTGVGASVTSFQICRSGDVEGSPQRIVNVDAGGRAASRVSEVGADGCP